MRVVKPFVWKEKYLKVHPNGAAIFHEQKKLAFLLPLIVEAHSLLLPTPLFWVNDDRTIPLWRTTLWLHEDAIQWLAETGESYPPELRDEIQPRLDQLKPSQNNPQRNRLCKHHKNLLHRSRRDLRTHRSRSLTEKDNIWNCKQFFPKRDKADQRIPHSPKYQRACRPQARKLQEKPTLPCHLNQIPKRQQRPQLTQRTTGPAKVSAQSLFNQRPAPPTSLDTCQPETDTPGTGALSTHSPHPTAPIRAEQQQPPKQEQPSVDKEIPTEESTPVDTPNESPDTQATDTLSLIARPTRKLTSLQLTFLHCKTCRRQPVKQILLRLRRL